MDGQYGTVWAPHTNRTKVGMNVAIVAALIEAERRGMLRAADLLEEYRFRPKPEEAAAYIRREATGTE
jgi:hypothetical protein